MANLSHFRDDRELAMRVVSHQLRLLDRPTGEEQWWEYLSDTCLSRLVQQGPMSQEPRFRYHNLGHLVLLPLAHRVFALDPVGKRRLWERNLWDEGQPGENPNYRGHVYNPADGSLKIRIDKVYPLADASQAHRDIEGRKTTGKLVLHT